MGHSTITVQVRRLYRRAPLAGAFASPVNEAGPAFEGALCFESAPDPAAAGAGTMGRVASPPVAAGLGPAAGAPALELDCTGTDDEALAAERVEGADCSGAAMLV